MFKLLSYTLLSFMLCTTSYINASETENLREAKHTFNVSENFSLKIENLCGEFRIVKSETPQVEVEMKFHAPDGVLKSLQPEIKELDNKIKIEMQYPVKKITNYCYPKHIKSNLSTKLKYQKVSVDVLNKENPDEEIWVDFLIKLPNGGNTTIQNYVGDVLIDGVTGSVKVETASGNNNAKNHSGELKFKVGFGNVSVEDSKSNVSAKTGSGIISIVNSQGNEISVSSGSGDLLCSKSNFSNINFQTGSGKINILSSSGSIDASSGSGDISVEDPSGKKITLQSGSGHIDIFGNTMNLQKVNIKTGCGDVMIFGSKIPSLKYSLSSAAGKISVNVPEVELTTDSKGNVLAEGKKPVAGSIDISSGSGNIEIKQK